jgi:ATP-dependent Clp protease ATP-binding subunit ClpA
VSKQAAQKRFVPKKSDDLDLLSDGVWSRFTARARQIVERAAEEARRLGHSHVGTEHLLLGLLTEPDGLAAKAIEAQGVTLGQVGEAVRARLGSGGEPVEGHVPFTAAAKKVRELTVREALRLGHNYVGTEHVLLGLLREEDGVAAEVLAEVGVTREATETWVRATLEELRKGRSI